MDAEEKKFNVQKLVDAFNAGSLLRNPEYQRGEAWSDLQKASFIDSILRRYPVPALFFHKVEKPGLDNSPVAKYEIVDGQQRLSALRDFFAGKFACFEVGERSKLRLPKSVREAPAPWAGRLYSDLADPLKGQFKNTEITVFQIGPQAHSDEVRDLFIRLQSGTALSRQQIRDAWPGTLGPFIEGLAGKLDRHPSSALFGVIDKRGQRSEDEDLRDNFVTDRQICAQLLHIFIARERDPFAFPSVSANELDSLYHEHTDFDASSMLARRFGEVLRTTGEIFKQARIERPNLKNKFRRFDVTAALMFVQDTSRNEHLKLPPQALNALAKGIVDAELKDAPKGKSTSGQALRSFYEWWREHVAAGVGVRLDVRRAFDAGQRKEIRKLGGGKCAVCGSTVDKGEEEYDHFPVRHRDGGKTEVANGRLVHRNCHPRGRPDAA